MTKKYKDLKNKNLSDSLTTQENKAVGDVEDYIDIQIELQWENGTVLIDECIVKFECDPLTNAPTTFPHEKRDIMTELLFSRYRDNDWKNNLAPNFKWRFTPLIT